MTFPITIESLSTLTTISTAIGVVGGLLGMYTFFDNYILKFKPKFVIADQIYLTYQINKKHREYSHLYSLIAQFEIFNHRNKLGRIEDLIIRIYDSKEQEPKIINLYPIATLLSLPLTREDVLTEKRILPTSIAINNKSSKTLIVEMGQENLHTGTVSSEGHLRAEALYKSSNGKWHKFAKYSLISAYKELTEIEEFKVYSFQLTNKYFERKSLEKRKMRIEKGSYKGLSDYYLTLWLPRPYRKIRSMAKETLRLVEFIYSSVQALFYSVYSEIVAWNVIKRTYKYSRKPNFRFGNQYNAEQTELLLRKLGNIFRKKLEKLQSVPPGSTDIKFEEKNNELILSKYDSHLKIYKGGDGYIYAHLMSPNSTGVIKTIFSISITNYVFGLTMWKSDGRPIMPSTIATKMLDYVGLINNGR